MLKEKIQENAKDIVIFLMIIGLGVFLYKHKQEENKRQAQQTVIETNDAPHSNIKTMNIINFNKRVR